MKVKDPLNNTITYGYDTQGNLTRTVQTAADTGKSATTTLTYDGLGRKIATDDPSKGRWTYEYNALGELVKQTDAKGQIQTLRYDLLGRQVGRTDKKADGAVEGEAVWVYDTKKVGLLSETRDNKSGFKKVLSYDNYSRLSGVATTFHKVTYHQRTTYDSYGQVKDWKLYTRQ